MYKEIIIIIIVIVLIISLDIFTDNYTKNTVSIITSKFNSLEEELKKEDKEKGKAKISDINEFWEQRYKKLAFYLEHDELEKVKTELTKLNANIETEEYEEAIVNIETIKFILTHIQDKEEFSLQSIF